MGHIIEVIDLFAGPGGLSEGFSSFKAVDGSAPFKIAASAEMDSSAHKTLSLRALYRRVKSTSECAVEKKYKEILKTLAGDTTLDPSAVIEGTNLHSHWAHVKNEALCIELGSENGNNLLRNRLKSINRSNALVLIGGPPCQAYSLAGRSRNRGKAGYKPEEDGRHFLYKQYLQILREYQPEIFVMENVKGMLSSSVGGRYICEQIFEDLRNPAKTNTQCQEKNSLRYNLYSLEENPESDQKTKTAGKQFVIHAEKFGVPQCRHRVIILGIREDAEPQCKSKIGKLLPSVSPLHTIDAIGDLPWLRSGITGRKTTSAEWKTVIDEHIKGIKKITRRSDPKVWNRLKNLKLRKDLSQKTTVYDETKSSQRTRDLYRSDIESGIIFNHEARNHMVSDLGRYLFCSTYGREHGRSPSSSDFPLSMAPMHRNWNQGVFSDRFRVQLAEWPSSTVVSHIAKDGHAFIHHDERQCRSLTVREAARLQTFPDNYLFLGSRTDQYTQVGNAVPVHLAHQIARIVYNIISGS